MIVALAQMTSRQDVSDNLKTCRRLALEARDRGAQWVLYPENAPFLGVEREKLAIMEDVEGEIVGVFRELARELSCHITIGSFAQQSPDPERTYNTQVLIRPDGEIASTYQKIHLFDATLPGGQVLLESDAIVAGDQPSLTTLEGDRDWVIGQTICYDLRFPELYRQLRTQGAEVFTVPSAFTIPTGHAHWHALLRARAIENQCYVLAPNQWGAHAPGRASFGQSTIYDPWGRCLATAPEAQAVITAELRADILEDVRARMPVQSHRRL